VCDGPCRDPASMIGKQARVRRGVGNGWAELMRLTLSLPIACQRAAMSCVKDALGTGAYRRRHPPRASSGRVRQISTKSDPGSDSGKSAARRGQRLGRAHAPHDQSARPPRI
jgi:hypothetical protein